MGRILARIVLLQFVIFWSVDGCRLDDLPNFFNCKLDDVIHGIDILTDAMNGTLVLTTGFKTQLKDLRRRVTNGLPVFDLSLLDPLSIDRVDIDVRDPALMYEPVASRVTGYMKNVRIKHISNFRLDDIKIRGTDLFVNFTFPFLEVDGYYDIVGEVVDMFRIFGKGHYWLKLFKFSVTTFFELGVSPRTRSPLPIKSLRLTPKLQSLENNFEGLMGDNEDLRNVFNQCITSLGPRMLDMLWPRVEDGVTKQLLSIANSKIMLAELAKFRRIAKFELKSRND